MKQYIDKITRPGKNHDRIYNKYRSFTMIPPNKFADNLSLCKLAPANGHVVECGVWRGGMIAAVAETLGNAYEYHLFDSFEGLPQAGNVDGPDAMLWQKDTTDSGYFENCKAEKEFAVNAMKLAGNVKYKLYAGWFNDTVPAAADGLKDIAVLRLDGDWYESTMVCLQHLFTKVMDNGIVIIDDYYTWDGCTKAVHEFLAGFLPANRIRSTQNGVAYIVKNETNEYRKYKNL